jgi:6-phosphogluconolactonase
MQHPSHRILNVVRSTLPLLVTAVGLASALTACGGGGDDGTAILLTNQLYTQSNESSNAVVHFNRNSDGTLVRAETTSTGGAGTNGIGASGALAPDSLASQHSIVLSTDGSILYTVNGGDDSISAMSVNQTTGALTLLKKNPATAGHIPNSLAVNKGYLYATFLGGSDALAAYKVASDGSLTQVGAYDLKALGGLTTASPTQVIASPDGASLVVNAGTGSNAIMSFPVNADGTLGTPVTNSTQLATPFAGAFLPQLSSPVYLATSTSLVSLTEFSYSAGALMQLSAGVASGIAGVAAPCWLVLNPAGTLAFVGNGSGVISTYSVSPTAGLKLLNATAATEAGVKTGVTSVAADSWVSADGKFLYTAYLGDDKVVAYSIGSDNTLTKLGQSVIGTSTGLSIQGLVGN